MARPAKPTTVSTGKIGKDAQRQRLEQENKLRGDSDNISPPDYLNEKQKKLFEDIVDHMKASKFLSNIDVHILSSYVVAVERIQWVDSLINQDPNQMLVKEVMSARKQHMDDFKRLSTELGFSPQARAKMGSLKLQMKEDEGDPLLNALKRVK